MGTFQRECKIPLGFLGIWCSCREIFKETVGLLWALLRDCEAFLKDCMALLKDCMALLKDCMALLTALSVAEVSTDAFTCVCV